MKHTQSELLMILNIVTIVLAPGGIAFAIRILWYFHKNPIKPPNDKEE